MKNIPKNLLNRSGMLFFFFFKRKEKETSLSFKISGIFITFAKGKISANN